jgi:hypothetical protein
MDRKKVKQIREALNDVDFSEIEKIFGVKVKFNGASFSSSNVVFKVELSEVTDGEVQTPEVVAFKTNAAFYGLSPEDLGAEFKHGRKKYKIVGLKTRNRKFPIIAEDSNGNRYKMPADLVKESLSA